MNNQGVFVKPFYYYLIPSVCLLALMSCSGPSGRNGSNGHSSIAYTLASSNLNASCASGAGLVVISGTDMNDNGRLDTSEIGNTNIVCNGANGKDGHNGLNGQNGQNGSDGPKGDTGSTGSTGATGQNGTNGSNGNNGADGRDGQDGHDGASVVVVQFCTDQGPTSYGHFPEQGLCIGGNLYGVYWNGSDAFLAEIVPGAYQSTSTGLKCSFSVSANCIVSQ